MTKKMNFFNQYANKNLLDQIPQGSTRLLIIILYRGNIDNIDLGKVGRSDIINHRTSLGYYYKGWIVRNTGLKRYSLRNNLVVQLARFFRTYLVVAASRIDRKMGLDRCF